MKLKINLDDLSEDEVKTLKNIMVKQQNYPEAAEIRNFFREKFENNGENVFKQLEILNKKHRENE